MITDGRVKVNRKKVVELGTKADPAIDRIEVDGKQLRSAGARRYILLNKPKSYISSANDPEGRPVVTDLVRKLRVRLFPVGRLDYDAEGVLLMTDDGELSAKLLHPRHKVPKTYQVKVKGNPDERALGRIRRGMRLEDGLTLPARVKLVRRTKENSWVEITVTEGRNRLVKRLFEKVRHPVQKLKRSSFAGLTVKGIKPGEWRELKPKEIERLRVGSGLEEAQKPRASKPKPERAGSAAKKTRAGSAPKKAYARTKPKTMRAGSATKKTRAGTGPGAPRSKSAEGKSRAGGKARSAGQKNVRARGVGPKSGVAPGTRKKRPSTKKTRSKN